MLFGLNGKIFLFLFFRNCAYLPPSRLTMRGGRVVTNARRDAVDAKCVARRAAFFSRTAKPCGPGAPMQVPSFSNLPRGDGDNKARSHRGEHGISCKPSRRECRRKRLTCGDLLVCFFIRTQGCGCGWRPAFPAPSSFREGSTHHSDAIAPRECGDVCSSLFDIQIGSSRQRRSIHLVMPALVAGIHVLLTVAQAEGVDGRVKARP